MNRICAEIGTVVAKKENGRIAVLIRRTEVCDSCEASEICAAYRTDLGDVTLVLENTLEAEVGDEVIVELVEIAPGRVSAAMIMVPSINLVLGGIVGIGLASIFHVDKDTAVIFGAGLGFCMGLFLSGRLGAKSGGGFGGKTLVPPQYVPVLMEIRRRISSVH